MLYTDVRYLKQVSYRLERFKIKKDTGSTFLANCRCPICGDSETNSKKTRGYFYNVANAILFKCHNCNASLSFGKWLKEYDNNLYNLYAVDKFRDKHGADPVTPSVERKMPDLRTKPYKPCVLEGLKSINDLDDAHPARAYVESRKIPETFWGDLYYAPRFHKWTLNHTDKFARVVKEFSNQEHPKLIIPFFTKDIREVFMYHARAFGDEKPKYISIKIDKKPPPFYGMDRVNMDERVYVVEGPIDSLFLPNAVAVGSSGLHVFDYDVEKTYVMDNENRNREILKEYKKLINMGYDVCIWPESYKFKDINEAVLAGLSILDIKRIIDDNTFNGLKAEMVFSQWRKVDNDYPIKKEKESDYENI